MAVPICRRMTQSARLASLVVVVISPQPLTPSSVVTSTNRNSPQYDPADLISHGLTPVIFISLLVLCPTLDAARWLRRSRSSLSPFGRGLGRAPGHPHLLDDVPPGAFDVLGDDPGGRVAVLPL